MKIRLSLRISGLEDLKPSRGSLEFGANLDLYLISDHLQRCQQERALRMREFVGLSVGDLCDGFHASHKRFRGSYRHRSLQDMVQFEI